MMRKNQKLPRSRSNIDMSPRGSLDDNAFDTVTEFVYSLQAQRSDQKPSISALPSSQGRLAEPLRPKRRSPERSVVVHTQPSFISHHLQNLLPRSNSINWLNPHSADMSIGDDESYYEESTSYDQSVASIDEDGGSFMDSSGEEVDDFRAVRRRPNKLYPHHFGREDHSIDDTEGAMRRQLLCTATEKKGNLMQRHKTQRTMVPT